MSVTAGLSIHTPVSLCPTQTTAPLSSEQQLPEGLMFMPAQAGGAPVHMSFSPFPSGDGSWTPTFDPNIMSAAGFGFAAAPSMMPHQHMQNQFYFTGADVGIWGQGDPLMYLLGPTMAMDQSGSTVALDPTMTSSVDPITGLAHGFTGMALNGTMQGMMPVGQTSVMASPTGVSPAGMENSAQNSGADVSSVASQGQNSAPQPEKPKSWAAIASQPAKPRPPPPPKPQPTPQEIHQELPSRKPQSAGGGGGVGRGGGASQQIKGQSQGVSGGGAGRGRRTTHQAHAPSGSGKSKGSATQSDVVGKLLAENKYNPSEMNLDLTNARFFVIKSYSEDDIHRSIKYSIWTSTEHGNRRLEQAFREQKGKGNVYMLFSVNGSGHFCGMAQMMSEVDFNTTTGVWAQDKWKGRFDVRWIYVKDVPNSQLRHIRLENNENKPVTNSRDTQEVPMEKARQVVKIIHSYHHTTSIFDDFEHYEKKQEEDDTKKVCQGQGSLSMLL